MKKILITFIVLLSITGCSNNPNVEKEEVNNTCKECEICKEDEPVEKNDNFELYNISKYNSSMYQYFIFNDNGSATRFPISE